MEGMEMNAKELADGLEQFSDFGGKFFAECGNILRQQADRIAELEKERQGLCVFCKNRDLTPQTKPLSDEPIAYVPLLEWEYFSSGLRELKENHMTNEQFIRRCEEVVRARALYENDTQFSTQLHPQTKPLSDEEMNKAFDYYCETDEGVLRFDFELRKEWKEKELQRWKDAFARAIEERILGK